jgi:hypothetical protein
MKQVLVAVVTAASVLLVASCTSSSSGGSCNSTCQASIEALNRTFMASLSAAAAPDPASDLATADGSTDLATYSAGLDEWQAKCTDDRAALARYVETVYRQEQKFGGVAGDTSRLDVMGHLTDSVPAIAGRMKCDEIAAAYLTLVENGN